MKYCPFCGAELLPRRPFFLPGVWGSPACVPGQCTGVGCSHPREAPEAKPEIPRRSRNRFQLRRLLRRCGNPIDADREREGMGTRLIGKVALVCLGVALVIGGCVAVLFLL